MILSLSHIKTFFKKVPCAPCAIQVSVLLCSKMNEKEYDNNTENLLNLVCEGVEIPAEDNSEMKALFDSSSDWEFDMDGDEDTYTTYSLSSCTVEVNGESRRATEEELEYFNSEFANEINDEGCDYWSDQCL